ncbi:MAG: alginate export family protein [Acidobacteriota bacterium]
MTLPASRPSTRRSARYCVRAFLLIFLLASLRVGLAEEADSEAKGGNPPEAEPRASSTPIPEFKNIRYAEKWTTVRASAVSERYKEIKYIPLNESGLFYLSLGGQLRLRSESWWSYGFREGLDDTFGLSRLRVHADMWVGPHVRFFVEGKSALATDRNLPGGLRNIDVDTLDLENAFVELAGGDGSVGLMLGRQELQYGKQRLVSPLDWANSRRTFDVARASVHHAKWNVDGFWGMLVPVHKYEFNTPRRGDTDFFGVYATRNLAPRNFQMDVYWLGLNRRSATFGNLTARENRQTFGSRFGGRWIDSGDFDLEGAVQVGSHGNRDILAAMFTTQLGYTWAGLRWAPRAYANFDYASGDGNPDDGRLGTFNQLFPLGHAYLGFADFVGRQNIEDLSMGLAISPIRRVRLSADWHNFWRADPHDALYNPGGAVVRPGNATESASVGREVDLVGRYFFSRYVATELGYCHFFTGAFLRESGTDSPVHFLYGQIILTL